MNIKRAERRPCAEERFWGRVLKSDGCWLWTGNTSRGYGHIRANGKRTYVHRYSYELHVGPIPGGMFIDHICHTRNCVRPDHLRLATPKQNAEYRQGPSPINKSSGVRGVRPSGNRWRVDIGHNDRLIYCGTYATIAEAEAVAIRERARIFDFPEKGAA